MTDGTAVNPTPPKFIDDGGPAFPGEQGLDSNGRRNPTWMSGMSLRAWFAGLAMAAILSRPEPPKIGETVAEWALENADSLIAALKEPK